MATSNHPGRILPQDTAPGDADEEANVGTAVSQTEIEDLLYGDDRPVQDRLRRLDELAADLRLRQSGALRRDDDTGALLDEIDRAIEELSAGNEEGPSMLDGMLIDDPLDHRETLAPDSDELADLEAEDARTDDTEP